MAAERPRPWVAFTEGAIFDRTAAQDALLTHIAGCTPADLAELRATGEYDDPWELARAVNVWVRARRPRPVPLGGWRRMVNLYGDDPGDLAARCERLWRERYARRQPLRVDAARLARLAEGAQLAFATNLPRDEAEALREGVGAPLTGMLLAGDELNGLATRGHLVGVSEQDRARAEAANWLFHAAGADPAGLIDRLTSRLVR